MEKLSRYSDNIQSTYFRWKNSNSLQYVALFCAAGLAFIIRSRIARTIQHPGHGDHAYYLALAENLVNGRGFQIDYVWHFLNQPQSITHPSNDFWMPLTSVIIAGFLRVLGNSIFSAMLPSMLFGICMALPTYFYARAYSKSKIVTISSTTLVLFAPGLFNMSLYTDSPIYYALFASSALLFMALGVKQQFYFIIAAGFAGLAHLTRQDGILIFLTLLFILIISQHPGKFKLLIGCSVIYLAVLSPLIVSNLIAFGTPLPTGPVKTMYITSYEDIYSASKDLSLRSYLGWGLRNILDSKLYAANLNVKTLSSISGKFLAIFIFAGLLSSRRKFRMVLPPLVFTFLLFVFQTSLYTIPSPISFSRSIVSITPFILVVGIDSVYRHIPSKPLATLLILAFVGLPYFSSPRNFVEKEGRLINNIGHNMTQLKITLYEYCDSREVVMTRDPWELHYSTRYQTLQIPNDDLETVYEMAKKYNAHCLVLPSRENQFEEIYLGTQKDPRFQHVADVPDTQLKLFHIVYDLNTRSD